MLKELQAEQDGFSGNGSVVLVKILSYETLFYSSIFIIIFSVYD